MNKKLFCVFLATFILVISFSACSLKSEKERLKDATVELSCEVVQKSLSNFEEMLTNPMNPEEIQKNMEAKMDEIAKKHGFENAEEIETIGKNYEKDAKFEGEINKAVKDECGLDLGAMKNLGNGL